jgi:hypothetical protein
MKFPEIRKAILSCNSCGKPFAPGEMALCTECRTRLNLPIEKDILCQLFDLMKAHLDGQPAPRLPVELEGKLYDFRDGYEEVKVIVKE